MSIYFNSALPKEHADFSPSASERWLNCPGSVRLCLACPPSPDTAASILGTNTHSLLERKLLNLPITPSFKRDISWTKDMDMWANKAVDEVEISLMEVENNDNLTFQVESRAELSHIVDADMWGKSDITIAEEFGVLHVQDYKNGLKKVSPVENPQGLAYVLGIADSFGYNFESYKFSIIQPRVPSKRGKIVSSWAFGQDRLDLQKQIFRSAVALSKKKSAPLREGSWCWFCPANKNQSCPKKKDRQLKEAMNFFDQHNGDY